MIKVFLSYSHEDEALRAELHKHLGALRHGKIIETWSDHQVPIGSNWDEQISGKLEEADLILLLVSASFLDSQYCSVKEMQRAIERHNRREAIVVPILLRPCHWKPAPFAGIQGLPKSLVPVTKAPEHERDEVWAEIAEGIHQAAIACNEFRRGGATKSEARSASYPSITIASIRAVDEAEIHGIIKNFKKGQRVGIKWPNSSDQLISLMREVTSKFDEMRIPPGDSRDMIERAPEAAADALRYREKCERRLPEVMSIMIDYARSNSEKRPILKDYYERNCASAIKHYLIWANFLGHRFLGRLTSWVELWLKLEAPAAWIPFRHMSDQEWLANLYPSLGRSVTSMELRRIAGQELAASLPGLPWPFYVPSIIVDDQGTFATDNTAVVCEWFVPQIELCSLGLLPLKSYDGVWEGHTPKRINFF
jgi:hypothetical protein